MPHDVETFDAERFRSVLGSYPTGVAVVTGFSATGEPLGLVVGSFTSVSLEPPLVAFLPMKSSKSFEVLRAGSDHFCVNILAADQEDICRQLAAPGEHKFAHIQWRASPLGDPIIEGAVSWIQCTYEQVLEGGDHFIVLGRVQAMDVERDTNPLLFFQRGYGKFTTGTMVIAREQATLGWARMAETVRDDLEALAQAQQLEASLIAPVAHDSVYVAVADRARAGAAPRVARLGLSTPMTPPLACLFVNQPHGIEEAAWLKRLGKASQATLEIARHKLHLAQQRGFALSLLGAVPVPQLEEAVALYSNTQRTPEQERKFLATVSQMFDLHEPETIDLHTRYPVLHISVPVRNAQGETVLLLRLAEFAEPLTGQQVQELVATMQRTAQQMQSKIGA